MSAFFAKFKKAHSRQKCDQLWTLQMILDTGNRACDNFYKVKQSRYRPGVAQRVPRS